MFRTDIRQDLAVAQRELKRENKHLRELQKIIASYDKHVAKMQRTLLQQELVIKTVNRAKPYTGIDFTKRLDLAKQYLRAMEFNFWCDRRLDGHYVIKNKQSLQAPVIRNLAKLADKVSYTFLSTATRNYGVCRTPKGLAIVRFHFYEGKRK